MRLRPPAYLLLAVFFVACGSDKKESSPTYSPEDLAVLATRAVPTSSDAQLEASLLLPSDLGLEWIKEPPSSTATVADQVFCGEKVDGLPPTASATFSNGNPGVSFMYQILSKFNDTSGAETAMAKTRNAAEGCDELVSTDGVRATTFEFEPAGDLPSLGDETLAFRATRQFDDNLPPNEAYFVQIRYGAVVMLLAIVIVEGGTVDVSEIVRIVEAADRSYFESVLAN